jgi:hypothetical protein
MLTNAQVSPYETFVKIVLSFSSEHESALYFLAIIEALDAAAMTAIISNDMINIHNLCMT